MMLHEETVEKPTLELIKKLSQDKQLQDFVLVGGTALALQLGHRKSVNIDLFPGNDVTVKRLAPHLESTYRADITATTDNGIFGFIDDIKISFIGHPYPAIRPAITTDGV